jgi:hypothetical protein
MTTITIPKKFSQKGDLVVIPRKEYEQLLKRQRVIPVAKLTPAEKRALEQGRKEIATGNYVTLETLEHELGTASRKKR